MKKLVKFLLLLTMLCPLCQKAKMQSKVYYVGSETHLIDCEPYWDENGDFKQPACKEQVLHRYRCSLGDIFGYTPEELAEMTKKQDEKKAKEKKK